MNFEKIQMDVIEKGLEVTEGEIKAKAFSLADQFQPKISVSEGIQNVTERVRDNGVLERMWENEAGHKVKEYLTGDKPYLQREILDGGNVKTTYFDDNGTPYLKKVVRLIDNKAELRSFQLAPDTNITRGNFTCQTDFLGRPVLNTMKDIQLRSESTPRESLHRIIRDEAYRPGDHKGHLIPDSFYGPASEENIIPQLDKINQGKMKQVENIARDLKKAGHTVDYEVKTNYVAKETRPSSFEVKITVDGQEYKDIPEELAKIYNDGTDSAVSHAVTTAGEHLGLAAELGLQAGLVAGGLTCVISTVDNVSSYMDGEITAEDMVIDIVKDTAAATALAGGTTFVGTAVAQAMAQSSVGLINSVAGTCLPAAAVTFAVASYSGISDFMQGEISASELAYELGDNAATLAGGMAGSSVAGAAGMAAGAVVGSIAGPAGTVVGGMVGGVAGTIAGGVVGCVLASEAYETAVVYGAQGAELLAEKAGQFASVTVDAIKEVAPEQLDNVKSAFNDFLGKTSIPFRFSA